MINAVFAILYVVMGIMFWMRSSMYFDLEENLSGYWNLFCSAACGAGLLLILT